MLRSISVWHLLVLGLGFLAVATVVVGLVVGIVLAVRRRDPRPPVG